ncbi:amidohydrolase family protein [Pigmentiphaga litoralis]|uniref:amidohydrolase family protein n=1 Tax=Pigmentiphaga litoralis TaxID=516702 RepID=UPI003B43D1DF
MTRPVIDIHPHLISPDTATYPRAPLHGKPSAWSQERPTTIDQLLAAMDDAGVAKAAIVQSSTCYGFDNAYVADAVAAHPDRFTGVFSVDVMAADAPDRIRHWVGRKLTGLRLFTAGSTISGQAPGLGDPASFPAWDCAAALMLPVCVQMRTAGLPQLKVLLDRYPDLPIIIDHLLNLPLDDGPPYHEAEALYALSAYPNIYLKLTPVILKRAREGKATPESFFKQVFAEFGAPRIAWGSNFPASPGSLKDLLRDTQAALAWASANDQDWVFRKTAETLYPALQSGREPVARDDNKEIA